MARRNSRRSTRVPQIPAAQRATRAAESKREEIETVLRGLEAALENDHPVFVAARPALVQKLRSVVLGEAGRNLPKVVRHG